MCGKKPCHLPNCTWSPKYLRECEARFVARMPAEWRRDFYIDVEKKRGKEALAEMKEMVKVAWKDQQSQQESLF